MERLPVDVRSGTYVVFFYSDFIHFCVVMGFEVLDKDFQPSFKYPTDATVKYFGVPAESTFQSQFNEAFGLNMAFNALTLL